jgi:GAF domain-containing protein
LVKNVLSNTLIGASNASFFIFREGETILECTNTWTDKREISEKECFIKLRAKDIHWLIDRINSGEVICIEDTSAIEEFSGKSEFERLGVKSFVGLPVYIDERPGGLLCFFNVLQNELWSDEDLMLLKVFSRILGSSLERRRAEDDLRKSLERLQKSMKGTIFAISKIYENTQKPSRFGRSPGI